MEEMKMSKKHFAGFVKVLKTYVDGKCDLEDVEENQVIRASAMDQDDSGDDTEDVFR